MDLAGSLVKMRGHNRAQPRGKAAWGGGGGGIRVVERVRMATKRERTGTSSLAVRVGVARLLGAERSGGGTRRWGVGMLGAGLSSGVHKRVGRQERTPYESAQVVKRGCEGSPSESARGAEVGAGGERQGEGAQAPYGVEEKGAKTRQTRGEDADLAGGLVTGEGEGGGDNDNDSCGGGSNGGGGDGTRVCGGGGWTPSPTLHEQSLELGVLSFIFSNVGGGGSLPLL